MNLRCLSNSMISDQSTSLFMLRSNALTQQITLLSCSLFLVSSILFLPIFNRHPVDTVLIPFANIEKYPSNVASLGFAIGGCLNVVNTLFSEWAKRHEGQRANRESQELLAMLSPEVQTMISDWHARVVKRMEMDRRMTPASSMDRAKHGPPFTARDAPPAAIVNAQTWLAKAEGAPVTTAVGVAPKFFCDGEFF